MLKRMLKSYDYSLLFAIILISAFGLVMVYSSSMITSVIRYDAAPDNFFKKQLLFMICWGSHLNLYGIISISAVFK